MKIGVIIQARMGSTRLPKKVLMDIKGSSVIEHVIKRVKLVRNIDEIIVATSKNPENNVFERISKNSNVGFFQGSEENVLSRFYEAAKLYKLDIVIRITSDCPLIDPKIIEEMVRVYLMNGYSVLTNGGLNQEDRTFPRGLDVSIFTFNCLQEAYNNATKKYQLEHVVPYIYENNDVHYFKNSINLSKLRWTLDTIEDFELITEIYKALYNGEHNFFMDDIVKLFDKNKQLFLINSEVNQKKIEK
jgi:spore coat polysaccharide biosynthesis protein SpsF